MAGGATASAHARRASEDAEIVMFEVVELVPSKQQIQVCDRALIKSIGKPMMI